MSSEEHSEEATTKLAETSPILPSQKVDRGLTVFLIFTVSTIILGSFNFGYSIGVINSPKNAIMNCNTTTGFFKPCVPFEYGEDMNTFLWSTVVSILTIGAMIGGLVGGKIADWIGRKQFLFYSNIAFIVGSFIEGFFSHVASLIVGRFVIGLGTGFASAVVPVYIAEISPDKYRGAMGTLHQLAVNIGIFISQVLGIFMSDQPHWRFLLGFQMVPSILQMVLLPFCGQSPRWLVQVGKEEMAEAALKKFSGSDDVKQDLEDIKQGVLRDQKNQGGIRALFRKSLVKPIIIALSLHAFQQLSGINVIMSYSKGIFEGIGIESNIAGICVTLIGLVGVVLTLVSAFLLDRAGRRPLLIIGNIIEFFFFGLVMMCMFLRHYHGLTFNIIAVISVVMYNVGFQIGMGPIPWLILPEIVPSDVRGIVTGLGVAVNWGFNFIVQFSFLFLSKLLQNYVFLPFIAFIAITTVFIYFTVYETKGKSIEELTLNM